MTETLERARHPIDILAERYPQLCLPVREGASRTEEYLNITLKGACADACKHNFSCSSEDSLTIEETPAGCVEILFLPVRYDFELFLRIMAFKCEPQPIPPSMGAMTILNINNWRRIEKHREAYLLSGGADWAGEFKRFTNDRGNYQDTIIVLTRGFYSAVDAGRTVFTEGGWLEKSFVIRKYHELAHFVSRKLYPENTEALRDEIVADCIGISAALGAYDAALARIALGIEGGVYRQGGRLQNYLKAGQDPASNMERANALIDAIEEAAVAEENRSLPPFELLGLLEGQRIGKGSA